MSRRTDPNHVPPSKFYFDVRNFEGRVAAPQMAHIARKDDDAERKGREEVPVHNRAGREMTPFERHRFVEAAEQHNYVQRWHISPPNGNDLTRDELRKETRRVAHDYTRKRLSSRIAYAVHTDQSVNHVHVLIAGDEADLRMYREDVGDVRTNAYERMTANPRYRRRRAGVER